ncbi:MAG: CO or xanthine dehydrogenase, Mo-binding subunit [Chloroflexi bacterium]|jgi:CO/xanthine dehydrogenase Mo-binding subunit|nr:MAG: CO or xanthine dehydrogenase, Mo-binding subunit [Chloroflexota bacterium]
MNVVGASVRRPDALEKVSGRAVYTGDIELPGMAHGKLLASPYPHALITHIDGSNARRLPGVFGVLTRERLTGMDPYYGADIKDRPIIAMERARFQGEPVAAVAAVDLETAEAALDLIEVEYEELPPLTDSLKALEFDAPLLHLSNLCHEASYAWGDVERGFAEADRVFEDTFSFPMVYHYALEPHVCIAKFNGDGLAVWSSAQHPFLVRAELARIFDLPLSKVEVTVPYVGGGFGSKSYSKIEPLVAALSREAGRPVKLALTVDEAARMVRRHSAHCILRTAVRNDGTFLARECRMVLDTGAYADNASTVNDRCAHQVAGPYVWPNLKVTSSAVYTNSVPAGSFRAVGGPQAAWASESQVDIIADALGIDPVELRMKNLARYGDEVRKGERPLNADMTGALQQAVEAIQAGAEGRQTKEEDALDRQGPSLRSRTTGAWVKRGVGVACSILGAGAAAASTALVRLHMDGSATALVSSVEMGQGSRSAFGQVAAQSLSLPLDQIVVIASDTVAVPYDRSTGASRSTTMVGLAIQDAAREIKAQLLGLATTHFEAPEEALSFDNGNVVFGGESISYGALIRQMFGSAAGELMGRGYVTPGTGGLGQTPILWESAVGAAEVEVDTRTGAVRILRYVSASDVGKAINPKSVEGQDEGAAMQGMGHTLFEELVYEDGQLLNSNLVDYRVPSFDEVPEEFETILIENEDGPGPFGAKGVGECAITVVAPAVANAIFQATGVRIRELPLTPERVWRALRQEETASDGADVSPSL